MGSNAALLETKESAVTPTSYPLGCKVVGSSPSALFLRLLAEAALEKLDLPSSEAAFVRCKDYPGIQLVKRIANIQIENIRKAEVKVYFKEYEEAEKLYMESDRIDLAVALHRKLGDWFRVLTLLKSGGSGDDNQMEEALNNIGYHYAESHQWEEAVKFFEQAHNHPMLAKCYYNLEDFDALESLVRSLPENSDMLLEIADLFSTVGMSQQAVAAYLKCNRVKEAIDVCVELNQWHEAVELAKKHNLTEIGGLLARYASHLMEKGKRLQAIELFRKADKRLEAAKLLYDIAEDEVEKRSKPLRVKKLYVLAALLVEEHNSSRKETAVKTGGSRSEVLMGLYAEGAMENFPSVSYETLTGQNEGSGGIGILQDGDDRQTKANNMLVSPWRGAEAMHFMLLAQRQLYEGYVDAAMKTCLHLREYEGILPSEDIYSLLSLASCANRAFATCSRAFIKLEALSQISDELRESYEDLAMNIFMKYSPKDSRSNRAECTNCETMIPDWVGVCPSCNNRFSICIATGRPIMDPSSVWTCKTCRHSALEQDMAMRSHCPLCHTVVPSL